MRGEVVAIDLETTGLDPLADTIIEVGAVRMRDGEILEEYSTLVDPERRIPALITSITGIRDEDVLGAPRIQRVAAEVRAFVGNAPIVGHNVGFDAAFLYQQGILQTNSRIDTYDLASVLMPRAPRYSLSSLASQINIDLENAHRALDDARASGVLYWILWNRLLELPLATLYEINLLAQDLAWDSRIVLDAAIRQRLANGEQLPDINLDPALLFKPDDREQKPLKPHEMTMPVAVEDVVSLLQPGGTNCDSLPPG